MATYQQAGTTLPDNARVHRVPKAPDRVTVSQGGQTSNRGDTRRNTLNRQTTTSKAQTTTVADNEVAPLLYGLVSVGGKVVNWWDSGSYRYYLIVWGMGRCNSIVNTWADKIEDTSSQVSWVHYLGTTTQTADPWLVAAVTDYSDTGVATIDGEQVGFCYSVCRIASGTVINSFRAVIEGRLVYDPGTDTDIYSTNPSLIRADFFSDRAVGMGRTVDWTSVATCEAANDAQMGDGSARRSIGIVIDRRQNVETWAEILRTYASVYDYEDNGTWYMVPNRPRSVDHTLTEADIVLDSLKIRTYELSETPNVVRGWYTDTTTEPWQARPVVRPDPDEQPTPEVYTTNGPGRRETVIRLDGYQTYQTADREVLERLNRANLANLEIEFETFDEGLRIVPGDIVAITHSIGFTAKQFRVFSSEEYDIARFKHIAFEYQPNVFSDAVESVPEYPDTTDTNPLEPPDVTGLSLQSEVYQQQNGLYSERIRATWTATTFAFLRHYEYEVRVGPTLISQGTTATAEFATGPVQEGNTYRILVRVRSEAGPASENWTEETIVAAGKSLVPGDVPSITGTEFGGLVKLSWIRAVDVSEDILRYHTKYWLTTGGETWDDGETIDLVDALRTSTDEIAPGTYVFGVKARDSVGNESANAATVTLTVTQDLNALFVGEYDCSYSATDSTNIYAQTNPDGTEQYFTDMDEEPDANTLFSTTPLNNTNYPLAPISYHENSNSEFVSAEIDFGDEYTGTWSAVFNSVAVEGTITNYLDLATVSGGPYTSYTTASTKATARYARIRVRAVGADNTLAVTPGCKIRLDVQAKHEHGNGTLGAGGTDTVTLEGNYSFYKSISITPALNGSTVPGNAYYDNVSLSGGTDTFDVYVDDDTGTAMPSGSVYSWDFWGI